MPTERVVVVGSGVTGLACAAGFAKLGYPVTLCGDEPAAFDPAADYDLRVFALNEASCRLLKDLGAWDAVASQRLCAYEAMEVWSGRNRSRNRSRGRLKFHATDVARPRLGVIVENRLLCSALFERLRAHSQSPGGVEIRCPARLRSLRPVEDGAEDGGGVGSRVTFDDGVEIEASLVVGADGAASRVREQAGIGYERNSYGQDAIVATVESETAHGNVCLQRFSDEGVTAFLPLQGNPGVPDSPAGSPVGSSATSSPGSFLGSIVWSCDKPLADELVALPSAAFGERLSAALERRLGALVPVSERVAFPLYGALAEDYVGAGVALVGDAAHSVHPLAGQGANLGLADVAALLEVAASSERGRGQNLSWSALRRYQRHVKGRNLAMKYALDAIRRWFSDESLLPGGLQAAGLSFVDRCLPLKTWFMRRAIEGRGGRV